MARPPNTAGIPYFRYLDGLRCLSVFWVILLHLRLQGGRALEFIAGHGWMGVDMFFVISAF
jgi:peptidoglycan/LPS O-acetylase OafA/YrhL